MEDCVVSCFWGGVKCSDLTNPGLTKMDEVNMYKKFVIHPVVRTQTLSGDNGFPCV